jgi:hypothetical protein
MHLHSVKVGQVQWEQELAAVPTADLADTRQLLPLPEFLIPYQLPVNDDVPFESLLTVPAPERVAVYVHDWIVSWWIGVGAFTCGMTTMAALLRYL